METITLVTWNTQGNAFAEGKINNLINTYHPDIICLQECGNIWGTSVKFSNCIDNQINRGTFTYDEYEGPEYSVFYYPWNGACRCSMAVMVNSKFNGVLPCIMHSARRLNDGMGAYVAEQTVKCMNKKGVIVKDAKILLLGITFKENCPDVRNTKIVDIYHTLEEYTKNITVFDPWASYDHVKHEYDLDIVNELPTVEKFDAVILGVAHKEFLELDVKSLVKDGGVIYDVKGILPRDVVDGRL